MNGLTTVLRPGADQRDRAPVRRGTSVMVAVDAAVARGVQDPPQHHRDQDERHKPTDQRPEHATNIYDSPGVTQTPGGQAWSATCSLGDGNAQATCWRRSCRNTKRI